MTTTNDKLNNKASSCNGFKSSEVQISRKRITMKGIELSTIHSSFKPLVSQYISFIVKDFIEKQIDFIESKSLKVIKCKF